MRLWSLHPRYLDPAGLVALWREALLAQAVLAGRTRGYTKHPQLNRFREHGEPERAIGAFLQGVFDESLKRGYAFDGSKVWSTDNPVGDAGRIAGAPLAPITVSSGQMDYEWRHLRRKLAMRNRKWRRQLGSEPPEPHPLFVVTEGPVASWESTRFGLRRTSRDPRARPTS